MQALRFHQDLTNKVHVPHGVKPRARKVVRPSSRLLPRKTIYDRKLATANISELLKKACRCGKRCNNAFSSDDISQIRQKVLVENRASQNRILEDRLKKYGVVIDKQGSSQPVFKFSYHLARASNGRLKEVCSEFWYQAIGISKQRFLNLKKAVVSNQTSSAVFKRAKPRSDKVMNARYFMKDYVTKHGQAVPNKTEFHLQRGVTKSMVYKDYKEATERLLRSEEQTLQYAHFCKIWHQEFPHVKTLKSTDFARCDFCDRCQEQLKAEHPPHIRDDLKKVYGAHIRNQVQAREAYYRHNDKARKDPKYLSLINDGMTQNTTRLPRFVRKAKAWEKHTNAAAGPHLATHAMGTLCPGGPQKVPRGNYLNSKRSIKLALRAKSLLKEGLNPSIKF
jgi:hypothetical protein